MAAVAVLSLATHLLYNIHIKYGPSRKYRVLPNKGLVRRTNEDLLHKPVLKDVTSFKGYGKSLLNEKSGPKEIKNILSDMEAANITPEL